MLLFAFCGRAVRTWQLSRSQRVKKPQEAVTLICANTVKAHDTLMKNFHRILYIKISKFYNFLKKCFTNIFNTNFLIGNIEKM